MRRPEWHRRGIGNALMLELVARAGRFSLHALLARVATTNQTSLNMVKDFGLGDIGTMREVSRKFGKSVDAQVLEIRLGKRHDVSHS